MKQRNYIITTDKRDYLDLDIVNVPCLDGVVIRIQIIKVIRLPHHLVKEVCLKTAIHV